MKESFLESQNSGRAAQCTAIALLKMTIERKLWKGVMHMGEPSFPLGHAFPRKYMNEGKPFRILLSLEITPLLTKPFLSYYPLEIPWA